MEKNSKDWRNDIYDVFKDIGISLVSHIPDAGHTPLINLCEKDNEIDVVTLTTEQDGVGLSCGAFAGGRKKRTANAIKWCRKLYKCPGFTKYL